MNDQLKTKKQKSGITIGESLVTWSFIWQTFNKCNKDWDTAIDCFWKARNCKGKNGVQRYILCGFRHVNKYILQHSKDRESGQMEHIREWWLALYERKRDNSKECTSILSSLCEKFSLGDLYGNTKNTR